MPQEPILPTSHDTSATASVLSADRDATTMKQSPSFLAGLRDDIDLDYADIPICLCSLVSGLCDSTAFNASAVFVSMQTGNTIFLALGAAALPRNVPSCGSRPSAPSSPSCWASCSSARLARSGPAPSAPSPPASSRRPC
ncbi:hypothetical protein PG988_003345 [Apiospora saccharicola]